LEYEPGSWDDVVSQATVVHRDAERYFNEDASSAPGVAALDMVGGDPRKETLQKKFFCTPWQAKEFAAEYARTRGHPSQLVRGRRRVRRNKAVKRDGTPLMPGDLFGTDNETYQLDLVCRVIGRTDPREGGKVELTYEAERGLSPLPYVAPADPVPDLGAPTATAIANARVLQLPRGYLAEAAPAVAVLAERPAPAVAALQVYFSSDDATYDGLGAVGRWAVRGALSGAAGTGATTVTITAAGLDVVKLQPQSDAARDDDTLLLIVGNEIMSIGAVTALGAGTYECEVVRARRGSALQSHAS